MPRAEQPVQVTTLGVPAAWREPRGGGWAAWGEAEVRPSSLCLKVILLSCADTGSCGHARRAGQRRWQRGGQVCGQGHAGDIQEETR